MCQVAEVDSKSLQDGGPRHRLRIRHEKHAQTQGTSMHGRQLSHNCEYEAGTGVHSTMLLSFLRRQVAAYCSGRAAGPNILCERLDILSKCSWVRGDFYCHLAKNPRTPVVDIGPSGRRSPSFRTSLVAKCGEGKEGNQQPSASTSAQSFTTFSWSILERGTDMRLVSLG